MTNKRPIVYVAPDAQTIQRFVQRVCSQLTTSKNVNLQEKEVTRGLAQFLVFLARYEAKRRNTQSKHDSNEE